MVGRHALNVRTVVRIHQRVPVYVPVAKWERGGLQNRYESGFDPRPVLQLRVLSSADRTPVF